MPVSSRTSRTAVCAAVRPRARCSPSPTARTPANRRARAAAPPARACARRRERKPDLEPLRHASPARYARTLSACGEGWGEGAHSAWAETPSSIPRAADERPEWPVLRAPEVGDLVINSIATSNSWWCPRRSACSSRAPGPSPCREPGRVLQAFGERVAPNRRESASPCNQLEEFGLFVHAADVMRKHARPAPCAASSTSRASASGVHAARPGSKSIAQERPA